MTSPDGSQPISVATVSAASGPKRGRPTKAQTPRSSTVKKAAVNVSERELAEAMADILSVGMLAYFTFIVKVGANDRDALDVTNEEAEAFVKPIARLVSRSASRNTAGAIAGSKDWVVAAAACMAYADRAGPILARNRDRRHAESRVKTSQKGTKTNGRIRATAPEERPGGIPVGAPGGYGIGAQATFD